MILRKVSKIAFIFVLLLNSFLLGGCSSNSIVGTWKEVERNGTMAFYEDGTCSDVPVKTLTSADPVSYVIQEDGKLIFTMEWDGNIEYDKAETKEESMDDYDLYYLEGDTLVLRKTEYVRQ